MNFGLLKQERGCTVFAKQLDKDGKDLADAVPDVDYVSHRPFGRSTELPDLQLKGVAAPCAEPSDFDFVKKVGVLPESLQLLSCLLPLSTVRLQRHVGQQVGHVITFRIPCEVGGVVGAVWSRTHWRAGIKRSRPVVVEAVGVGQKAEGPPVLFVWNLGSARCQLVVAVAGKRAVWAQNMRQGNERHRVFAGAHFANVNGPSTSFRAKQKLPGLTRDLAGNFDPHATFITGQSCLDGKGHSAHISKNHRNTTHLARLRGRFEFETRFEAISPTTTPPAVVGDFVEAAEIVWIVLERRIGYRAIPKRADHGQERCLACAVFADEERQGRQHDILLLAEAAVVLQRDPVHVRLGAEPRRPIADPRSVATDGGDGMCSSTGRRDPTPPKRQQARRGTQGVVGGGRLARI